MFTRKISSESFDQSLHNDRQGISTDSPSKAFLEKGVSFNQSFDPETGEIFQKSSISELGQLKTSMTKVIPTILVNAVFALGISWLIYELINESQTKLSSQTKQLKHIHQGQSEILDAIDELYDKLSENLLNIEDLNKAALAPIVSADKVAPRAVIAAQNKPTPKPISLKGVKYLGFILHQNTHQVLLAVDGKVITSRIGDQLKEGWILSAIDEKKIIATTSSGHRQIIDLVQPGQ